VTIDDTKFVTNNEITDQEIVTEIKNNQITWYRISGPGAFAPICSTLGTVLVIYLLIL